MATRCLHLLLSFVGASSDIIPFGKPVRDAYFQFEPGLIYFNHGGYGATPKLVQDASVQYTTEMERQPTKWFAAPSAGHGYQRYLKRNLPLLAKILNCSPDDLVFLDNASAGMNEVLRSLSWKKGDIVLLIGSLYAVFPNVVARLQSRFGVRPIVVSIDYPVAGDGDYTSAVQQTLQSLSAAERSRVRLALVDHYSSYPSVLVPMEKIASLVKAETQGKALVFVDGAHALGQVQIDLQQHHKSGVDFYVMDGHKWFMSPHGSALLWAAPAVQDLLVPDVISSENKPGTPFQEAFHYIGTRDYSPWCAMGDAVDFRRQHLGGENRITSYLHELATYAHGTLTKRWGTEAVAPANMSGGLITVALPIPREWSSEAQDTCAKLFGDPFRDAYNMQIIPFTVKMHGKRTHVARLSAQVYLERSDFDDLAANVLKVVKTCNASTSEATV